ncbi:uroporphyrinogen-III C-methyltransferase [Chloroflexota bacterium]
MKNGKVYLVGAGPGDPGLITVKGLELLSQADVILYDRLLDERFIDSTPPTAERIYVGKTTGKHSRTQGEINLLLVEKAKEGKTVVRLKGGDPFVLGRGGEEAEALTQNRITFEVVPGISSAVAVPTYAGIPVTHRGLASSFAVVTGHEDPGKESSSIAWEKLATAVDTLVFLMGMQNLPQIVTRLIKHGRPADTPAAVIKDGTTPRQKTVVGTLADIAARVDEAKLSPPAVVVVGEVVSLREKLPWFDNRPLFGKRVLVTRSRHQASKLSRLLTEHGALPIELPVIDIQQPANYDELDRAIENLASYQWLVFTSTNGVDVFFHRLCTSNFDSRALCGLKIGAIGAATASALETNGIRPDYIPDVYTGQGFIEGLENQKISSQRFLLPRADIADHELTDGISRLGATVHEVTAYRTVPVAEVVSRAGKMLASGKIDVITFTSSSTVFNLVAGFEGKDPEVNGATIACIGPKTAATADRAGLKVDIIAGEQTITGLVASLEQYFTKET